MKSMVQVILFFALKLISMSILRVTVGFTVFINTRAINSVLFCSQTHDTSREGHTATPPLLHTAPQRANLPDQYNFSQPFVRLISIQSH